MQRLCVFLISLALSQNALAILYKIEPGATFNSIFTGEIVPLSGTFRWELENVGPESVGFAVTSLTFRTPSSISIVDPNPLFPMGSNTFFEDDPSRCLGSPCESFFGASILLQSFVPGLSGIFPGVITDSFSGDIEGSPFAPDRVTYEGVRFELNGIGGIGLANFSAVRVPEPSSLTLLFLSLVALVLSGRHLRNHSPTR